MSIKIFTINSKEDWFYIENKLFEIPEVKWVNSSREIRLQYPPFAKFPCYILMLNNYTLSHARSIEEIEKHFIIQYTQEKGHIPTTEELPKFQYSNVTSIIRKVKLEKLNEL